MTDVIELPDGFSPRELERIEATTREVGRYIFDHLSHGQPSVLQRRWWDDRIMAWAMHDEAVKVRLFRFIDVLPMLTSNPARLLGIEQRKGALVAGADADLVFLDDQLQIAGVVTRGRGLD